MRSVEKEKDIYRQNIVMVRPWIASSCEIEDVVFIICRYSRFSGEDANH